MAILRLLVVRVAVVLLAVRLLVVLLAAVVLLAVRLLVVLLAAVVLLAVLRLLVVRVAVRGLPGPLRAFGLPGPLRVLVGFAPARRLRRLGAVAPSAALLAAFRLRLRAAFLAIADRSALLSTMPHLKNRFVLYGTG